MCLGTAFVCGKNETGGTFFESVGQLLVTNFAAGKRPEKEARDERNAVRGASEKRTRFWARSFRFFRATLAAIPARRGGPQTQARGRQVGSPVPHHTPRTRSHVWTPEASRHARGGMPGRRKRPDTLEAACLDARGVETGMKWHVSTPEASRLARSGMSGRPERPDTHEEACLDAQYISCIHANIHTYIHADIHVDRQTDVRTYIHTYASGFDLSF